MSTSTAARTTKKTAPGAKSAAKSTKKANLRVVDKAALRRRRRSRSLLTAAAVIVTSALFAVALMYGQLVEGQQDIDELRTEIAEADAERARLEREVALASTPDAIVQRAIELGMVRAIDPKYLVAVRSAGEDK